jgi:hypothetical protein
MTFKIRPPLSVLAAQLLPEWPGTSLGELPLLPTYAQVNSTLILSMNQTDLMFFSGRVRERRCRHSLPSEPDVRVSPQPAQAATKPRVSGADFTTV